MLSRVTPSTLLAAVATSVMTALATLVATSCLNSTDEAGPRSVAPFDGLIAEERHSIDLFDQASPSVVNVTAFATRRSAFSRLTTEVPANQGSGFVWDKEGHIVTNLHVVADASGAQVTLSDHSTYKADLVGYYMDKDIAVLRIEAPASKLQPIDIGRSSEVRVGQKVFVIGNPFGLDQTLTTGIVSALDREIRAPDFDGQPTNRTIQNVIQTDAAINPGNSGGPLLDSSGRVIGVNDQIYSTTGSNLGIGFAIPIDEVNRIVPQIIAYGRVLRPQLGVELDVGVGRLLGLGGVVIRRVPAGTAASRAGLRGGGAYRTTGGWELEGDVILEADGKPTPDRDALLHVLESHEVGDSIELKVLRDDRALLIPVTLQVPQ